MPEEINTIPCIDCITLSMCRAQIKQNCAEGKPILNKVIHRCSILHNYIFQYKKFEVEEKYADFMIPQHECTIRRNEALAVIRYMVGPEKAKEFEGKLPA